MKNQTAPEERRSSEQGEQSFSDMLFRDLVQGRKISEEAERRLLEEITNDPAFREFLCKVAD